MRAVLLLVTVVLIAVVLLSGLAVADPPSVRALALRQASGFAAALPTPTSDPAGTPVDVATRQPVRIYSVRPQSPLAPSATPTPAPNPSQPSISPTPAEVPSPVPDDGEFRHTADGQAITEPAGLADDSGDSEAAQIGVLPSFGASALELEGVYTVQEGDTLWRAAIEMGLDLEETICAVSPDFSLEQPLVVGTVLAAPPLGTVCHRVSEGETVALIASTYGVEPATIMQHPWNQLAGIAPDQPLRAGRYVRVPMAFAATSALGDSDDFFSYMLGQPVNLSPYSVLAAGGPRRESAPEPVPANWPYGSGRFEWPVYGWLSNGYRQDHRAIDIAAQPGTFVTAADRGVVIRAGWNNQGYGRFVVVDHNIDYVTLYAHLDQVLVAEGDVVGTGQVLGTVGSTGNSTGPHLHFEIRDFGRRANPIEYLLR